MLFCPLKDHAVFRSFCPKGASVRKCIHVACWNEPVRPSASRSCQKSCTHRGSIWFKWHDNIRNSSQHSHLSHMAICPHRRQLEESTTSKTTPFHETTLPDGSENTTKPKSVAHLFDEYVFSSTCVAYYCKLIDVGEFWRSSPSGRWKRAVALYLYR